VYFPDNLIQGGKFDAKTLSLTAHTRLTAVNVKCDPKYADVKLASLSERTDEPPLAGAPKAVSKSKAAPVNSDADEQIYLVKITPKVSLPPGPFQFEIAVEARTQGGQTVRTGVWVSGRIRSIVYCSPETVVLGARRIGEVVEETVFIQSRNGDGFEVIAFNPDTKDLMVQPIAAAEGLARGFRVSQKVTQIGDCTELVRFSIRQANGANLDEILLPVRYHGMPSE
jgi:hypothetical protein